MEGLRPNGKSGVKTARRWLSRILPLALLLCCGRADASCGVRWGEPKDHFENVDSRGFVKIIRSAGRVDDKITLWLVFSTAKGGNSP